MFTSYIFTQPTPLPSRSGVIIIHMLQCCKGDNDSAVPVSSTIAGEGDKSITATVSSSKDIEAAISESFTTSDRA